MADSSIIQPFDRMLLEFAEDGELRESLRGLVERAFGEAGGQQLTVMSVITDCADPLAVLARAGARAVSASRYAGPVGVLRVGRGDDAYAVAVWPTQQDGVVHLIGSAPVTDERWRRVERWVANSAPRIVPFGLNQGDFDGIAAALSEQGRVEVSRLTARVVDDDSSYSRGWAERRRTRRPTYRQAMSEIEGLASARTLTLHVEDALSLHLRRRAGATYYGGSFRLFDDVVLYGLVNSGARRRELLSDRERRPAVRPERAIGVRVQEGAFSEPGSVVELLDALAEQRGMGVAVMHRNPYLHVAVTDYLDGSNFDAFVTSDDEVAIYPGYRASVGALTRLTEQIADRFAAREVADVPASRPPTRQELFTTG